MNLTPEHAMILAILAASEAASLEDCAARLGMPVDEIAVFSARAVRHGGRWPRKRVNTARSNN